MNQTASDSDGFSPLAELYALVGGGSGTAMLLGVIGGLVIFYYRKRKLQAQQQAQQEETKGVSEIDTEQNDIVSFDLERAAELAQTEMIASPITSNRLVRPLPPPLIAATLAARNSVTPKTVVRSPTPPPPIVRNYPVRKQPRRRSASVDTPTPSLQ